MNTRGSRSRVQGGVSSKGGETRLVGYGERVSNAIGMDGALWFGSSTAIIVMLVVLATSLAFFAFWIKQVQFGAVHAFVVAVMPASMINVVVALAFLLATPGGMCAKDETTWFLVTPFAVYSIVSLALCAFFLVAGDVRSRMGERVDALTISGTLTAYYAFLLILYPLACCVYALVHALAA